MSAKTEKPWWESKTIWLNIAVGVVAVVDSSTDVLQSVLPPDVMGSVLAVTAVVNVVLRAVTGQPVAVRRKPPAPAP